MELAEYLELFLAESREHLGAAQSIRARLERDPAEVKAWRQLMRHTHSLKGMAATMRFPSIVELAHAVEDLTERLETAPGGEARACLPLLGQALTCLDGLLESIQNGGGDRSPQAERLARLLRERSPAAAATDGSAGSDCPAARPESVPRDGHWQLDLPLHPDGTASSHGTVALIARISRLGRIVRAVPPSLTVERGQRCGRLRLLLASGRSAHGLERQLDAAVGRGAYALEAAPDSHPRPGPGPLPPPRWIRLRAEGLDAIADGLLELRREHSRLRSMLAPGGAAARLVFQRAEFRLKELYTTVIEHRLVGFDSVAQRLRQGVQDLAQQLGKPVRFEIVGGRVRVDRCVLDALVDPLLHALRNSIGHGLESPDERRAAGKSARGSLRLELSRAGERVRIRVEDDGRGMRPSDIKRAAVARGLLDAEDAAELTDEEALRLTTLPRLTTRTEVDHLSGRGFGLDVVRDRVEGLGGYVDIHSVAGHGCVVQLEVPLSRAIIQTLLVVVGGRRFAVPVETVARSVQVPGAGAAAEPGSLRLVELERALGLSATDRAPGPRVALLLAGENGRAGLIVDKVLGRQDLLIQPLRGPLTRLREYSGAALLDDGSIVLVLDPAQLEPLGLEQT